MPSMIRRVALAASAVMTAAILVAAPVAAKPLTQEHRSWSDSGEWSDCGPTYTFESSGHGVLAIKAGRSGDPTPYLSDNYEWTTIQRNPANGKWFKEHGNGLYKDLQITRLEGNVHRFIAQESGSPYTITTSDGRKVVMDRGLLRYQFDVDTLGDDDIDNDVFVEGSWSLIADHGSHPLFHMSGEDYCALAASLLS